MPKVSNGPSPSFDEMIQAERKKKSQTLAQQMFGRGRPASGLSSRSAREKDSNSLGSSLASRVGVTKRSSSASPKSSIDGQWKHDLHQPRSLRGNRSSNLTRAGNETRLYSALQKSTLGNGTETQVEARATPAAASMNIRGMAQGPYVVIASNFAPGTTAADIEAAMVPIGGNVESCRLVASNPTVMAEIVFTEREGAENVIATFNNQKADGKLLYVYMKQGGPSPIRPELNQPKPNPPSSSPLPEPRSAPPRPTQSSNDREMMDVDDTTANSSRPREPDPRDRPSVRSFDDRRGVQSSYQDGNYGYRDPYESSRRNDYGQDRRGRGLYSDSYYRGGQRYRP